MQLKHGRPSYIPEFFGFRNWTEVVEFSRMDDGEHLASFVNIIETHGERKLLDALSKTSTEQDADVTISTVHKAKGREWPGVRLAEDFSVPIVKEEDCSFDKEEVRLMYVALTRAMAAVNINKPYETYVECLRKVSDMK